MSDSSSHDEAVELRILGPLEARRGEHPVTLGGPRQRAVLARLALDAGRAVRAELLADDIWGDALPATAAKTLQKYVSELRKALGAQAIRSTPGGYLLDVDVDATRFERLVAERRWHEALALWRGEVLCDVEHVGSAEPERVRLTELHLTALERQLDEAVASGRGAAVIGELTTLVERHPTHERFAGLLMLALYRAGRQVDALRAYEQHRARLVESVGVEPDSDLRALEQAILEHDPSLVARAPAATTRGTPVARPLSTFVGRATDITAVRDALARARLLTLLGTGGVGKTRLAREVTASMAAHEPVWWIDLSAVQDGALLPATVAGVLALGAMEDDPRTQVVAALGGRGPALLALDNCEHVVDASAAFVADVLASAPAVRVLATSRIPLGVDGERVLPIAPLAPQEAVELFSQRARDAGVADRGAIDLGDVARICAAVDHLPLAIELAAAQVRALGISGLLDHLDTVLEFKGRRRDAPARHRSLAETIEWSYALLPEDLRRVFAALGVFRGTFDLDAALAVCGQGATLDSFSTLVDHSLLVAETAPGRPSRYRLLETLRMFALERLAVGGREAATRRAHAEHFAALIRTGGARLWGPEEAYWSARLDADESNVEAALGWARTTDPTFALSFGTSMVPYWDLRWKERIGLPYLEAVLNDVGAEHDELARAFALSAMSTLSANPGEASRAVGWAAEAVGVFRRLGHRAGLREALFALGSALGNAGSLDEAERALDEAVSLVTEVGDVVLHGRGLNHVSFVASRRGQHARALEVSREELATWEMLGSRRGRATALRHIAVHARYLGDLEAAETACAEAHEIWTELGDPTSVAHVDSTLADIARLRGDTDRADRLYTAVLEEFVAVGDRRCTASTCVNLARLAHTVGAAERAVALLLDAVRVRRELGDEAGLAECLEGLALEVSAQGRDSDAVTLLSAATNLRERSGAARTPDEQTIESAVRAGAALDTAATEQADLLGRQLDIDAVLALAAPARDGDRQTG